MMQKVVKFETKNTFIHFDSSDEDEQPPIRYEITCPGLIQESIFRTNSEVKREKVRKDLELHACGQCRPCAYFAFKKDGCRMGDDCEYCHLCDRSQVRRWQRLRSKAMQSEGICLGAAYAAGVHCREVDD